MNSCVILLAAQYSPVQYTDLQLFLNYPHLKLGLTTKIQGNKNTVISRKAQWIIRDQYSTVKNRHTEFQKNMCSFWNSPSTKQSLQSRGEGTSSSENNSKVKKKIKS